MLKRLSATIILAISLFAGSLGIANALPAPAPTMVQSCAPVQCVRFVQDYSRHSPTAKKKQVRKRRHQEQIAQPSQVVAQISNVYNYSAFQQCVIARESGGNPQIMNSTGHYGLYQFSEATWVAYGGNPADFGHASVAEQNQVFQNAIAAGGESNWAPYDGC